MRVYAYCWACGAEHDVTELKVLNVIQEKTCDHCNGIVISATGEGVFRVDDV